MKKLALAYFGTPDFSARLLEKILKDKSLPIEVKVVVTQPDKKVGRKQVVTKSPVKVIAEKYGISVKTGPVGGFLPPVLVHNVHSALSGPSTSATRFHDLDLVLLFAFGEIIPKELLTAPKHGFWNIHPSLLPKYRGASPVAYPLLNGDKETGVTLIQMDEKMDHGPIIGQEKVAINPKETKIELTNRLTDIGFNLFQKAVSQLINSGQVLTQPQDEAKASYTKLLTKADGFIALETLKRRIKSSPEEIFNKFRGLYLWPGVWTKIKIDGKEKRLKITDMDFESNKLSIKKIQLEGKNEVNFAQFDQRDRLS